MDKGQRKKINIAIDGPAGAGKSTVARLVANALGYIYIDTGAMYRAITYRAIQDRVIEPQQLNKIIELARKIDIQLLSGPNGQEVYADGEDVTETIRTTSVNNHVSGISQIKEVREVLANRQKELAVAKGVVMDGRDIGTQVLPDAEIKVFLTASVEKRAERRFKEMLGKNESISLAQLKDDIALRDRMDEERLISPLVQAKDAVLLDSTKMSIPQVVEHILELSRTITDGEK